MQKLGKAEGNLFLCKKGVLARIRMTSHLKLQLGDQKIDIIGDDEDSSVARETQEKGIQLV